MASYERDKDNNYMISSSPLLGEDDHYSYDHDDSDDGYHINPQGNSLSRLSVCTSSTYTNEEVDVDVNEYDFEGTRMFMSRLSIESYFDADDEEQLSDEKQGEEHMVLDLVTSSDSDKEHSGCYSLPATPPRRKRTQLGGLMVNKKSAGAKEYASENEAQKGVTRQGKTRKSLRGRRRRDARERWSVDGGGENNKIGGVRKEDYGYCNSFSGESEGGGGGSGLVVITRPKGGKRSLCMDLEEVKACRDLGFELEHEMMLEIPTSRVSLSGSTLDTSSGGNSPIANWRISSPGDDPREVKARLRVWAQAVALASASRHGGI